MVLARHLLSREGVSVSHGATGVDAPKKQESAKEFLNHLADKREVWEETPVASGVTVSWTREAQEQTEKNTLIRQRSGQKKNRKNTP